MSLGCPKNLVDTEIMLGHLRQEGWEVVAEPMAASLLLVNTCAFIASASQEAVDTILEMARYKEDDPGKRLVVAGCLVQRYGGELPAQFSEVDLFIGVNDFPLLPRILQDFPGLEEPRLFHGASPFDYAAAQPRYPATPRASAYLKIAEGCSHRCTYCTIPAIRGPLRSRSLDTLLAEAQALAASGVKELNLVAQDTTAYGRDRQGAPGLPELLRELCVIPGLEWLRVLYGHPARITTELLETMASNPQICPYLDLPIQHGHDEMLRRMGRGYTRQDFLSACRLIRDFIPQAALRTTVMVGFPGETEEHFAALFDLVQEVRFEHLGVFLYSPEEGTPAACFAPQVPRRLARKRARIIKTLQARIVKERLKSLKGTVQAVLVEGLSTESEYLLTGRLITQAPEIDGQVYITAGEARIGEIQPVRLIRALPYDLVGEVVGGGSGERI
ncbi:MAG: 30S ribosomal protein S12 methylthiotransferase RimO [Deltaproteobacteria bacterium]|nr:30S ribosomal protein S12 methylthiotransferase RimO [Deltaproteobacteria bacterium]